MSDVPERKTVVDWRAIRAERDAALAQVEALQREVEGLKKLETAARLVVQDHIHAHDMAGSGCCELIAQMASLLPSEPTKEGDDDENL